jgi:hypothetical protein
MRRGASPARLLADARNLTPLHRAGLYQNGRLPPILEGAARPLHDRAFPFPIAFLPPMEKARR